MRTVVFKCGKDKKRKDKTQLSKEEKSGPEKKQNKSKQASRPFSHNFANWALSFEMLDNNAPAMNECLLHLINSGMKDTFE